MSTSPLDAKKYATCWSQRSTWYLHGKQSSASSESSRWSRLNGGRYASISDIFWSPETSSQISTFGLWNRGDSTIHPSGFSRDTILTTPLCYPGRSDYSPVSYNVIPQTVALLHCVQIICLRQEHEFIVPFLDSPNCLGGSKPTAVPNFVHP